MQVNKTNPKASFKQRYVIDAKNMLEAVNKRELLAKALALGGAQDYYSDIDSVSRKMIVTTGDDTVDFFKELRKSSKQKVLDKFIKGAVDFGENMLREIKKPLIDIRKNFKIDKKDSKNVAENYHTLIDYLSLIDKKYKKGESPKLSDVFFAVKDVDKFSTEMNVLEEQDMSVREYLKKTDKIILKYLPEAHLFAKQDADNVKQHLNKILELASPL